MPAPDPCGFLTKTSLNHLLSIELSPIFSQMQIP